MSTTAGPTRIRTPTAPHFATPFAPQSKACRRIASWRWALAARSTESWRAMPTARRCARRSSGWTSGPPKQCDQLVSAVGADLLAERTGLVADASHSAPKMMWIRENEPQVWQQRGDARSGRFVCAASSFGHRTPRMPPTRRRRWCTTSPRATSTASCVRRRALTRPCCPPCGRRRTWSAPCDPMSPPISDCRPRVRWSSARETSTPRPSGQAPSNPGSSSTSPAPRNR